jgi:acetylornithine deacetylase/succinyl-diaminopimelate desuccinylase-like protein
VDGLDEWIAELADFLRIPSVSADPAAHDEVVRAGEWVRDFVRASGGEATIVDWNGQPLAVGTIAASTGAAEVPTVLCYGHFDVQPAEPLELWESPPFEATVRDGWLYARGAADDKGQLYLLLKAAQQLAAEGALPVHVRFVCDGEEETIGTSVVEYLAADAEGADAGVIYDSGFHRRGVPVFNIATRGLCYLHLRLRAADAGGALVRLLSAVVPVDGRLPEPLRPGIAVPGSGELADWLALQPGAAMLADRGARPADEQAAEEFYLRTWAEPAIDVHGVTAGPAVAEANLSIRIAPGQDVEAVGAELEAMIRAAVPASAELELTRLATSPPGLVPADSEVVRLGLDAFERALGRRPLLIRGGGTLPIVPALVAKGIPTILTGFDLPDGNAHAPNERLALEHLPLGIAASRELFLGLAALRPRQRD